MSTSITPSELLAHLDWVERLAQRLVHDPEQAQDLVQDTWLTALSRPPKHAGNLRGWLGSVLRSQARDTGRAESSRTVRERKTARAEGQAVVEQATVQHEVVELVLKLEEPYRTVLLMRYFQDMAVREIASKQGVAINTVRSQLVRAHGQLRESLDRKYASGGGRQAWAGLLLGATGSTALKSSLATPLLALGLALVVTLGGAAAWKALASERPARGEAELYLSAELNQINTASGPIAEPEAPSPERQQAGAATTSPEDSSLKTNATILLEVQDQQTGAPLSGLSWIVYEEGAGKNLLARGKTDTLGRARIPDMPCDDVLIVRTQRRAPNAPGFGAVWLTSEKPKRLLLKVGSGSSATGRVIDTQGTPLPGIEIVSDTRAEGSLRLTKSSSGLSALRGLGYAGGSGVSSSSFQEVLAVSDEEGRWKIEHLANMPEGVWIVDGTLRPETWTPVKLRVRDPAWPGGRFKDLYFGLEQSSTLDLGDVQLPANGTLAGIVQNMQGEPIAGVLVFTNDERFGPNDKELPFPGNFNFASGNLTDSDGHFEVESFGRGKSHVLMVHEPSGASKSTRHYGQVGPGGRMEVTIILGGQSTLHLSLKDPDGHPLFKGTLRPKRFGQPYPRLMFGLSNGDLHDKFPDQVTNGVLVYRLDQSFSSVASIELRLKGFRPRWLPFPETEGNEHELELILVPLHPIKLRTVIEEWDLKPAAGLLLSLHRGSLEGEVVASEPVFYGEHEVTLHTDEPGVYWASIENYTFGFLKPIKRGPFQTDSETQKIEIHSMDWEPGPNFSPSKPAAQPIHKTTPPVSGILPEGQVPILATTFTMDVRDRSTGLAIPSTRINYRSINVESTSKYRVDSYYDYSAQRCIIEVAPGDYILGARCKGYVSTELPDPIQGEPSQQVDLGIVYLDPLGDLECKVIATDGGPFTHKRIKWNASGLTGESTTDESGRFSFKGAAGSRAPWLGQLTNSDQVLLDPSIGFAHLKDESTPTEFVFQAVHKVEVRIAIRGLTIKEFFRSPSVQLIVKQNREAASGNPVRHWTQTLASPDGRTRIYKAFVVPGDYDVVFNLPSQEPIFHSISVSPEGEPQSFEVSIR